MSVQSLVEQRTDKRTRLSWPVSVWLPGAHRFFNGWSCDISRSGVFVKLPMTVPVKAGDFIELNFPRTVTLAKEKGVFARIKGGKVVRVERKGVVRDASIGIAIQFAQN